MLMLLTENSLDFETAKTAVSVLRWCPEKVCCILDSTCAGQNPQDIIGLGDGLPIVATAEEGIALGADELLLGIAVTGGRIPEAWRPIITTCLENGMDIWNGLHEFLSDMPEYCALAKKHNCKLHDLRRVPDDLNCATNEVKFLPVRRVLTVGTDCSSGKMSVCLTLRKGAVDRGVNAGFIATGQTGIMIEGHGISIDRVIADFATGASEQLILEQKERDILFIEGQGSIAHLAFSPVTLAQIHGSAPTEMILCHVCGRTQTRGLDNPEPLPSMARVIATYEDLTSYQLPAKVIGVALNTINLSDAEAEAEVSRTQKETNLPTTDVIRFGPEKLLDALGL